ncbi:N-formylglutamate amidohydrolase [Candidimonas sp. SYP-B2681]|uniref:N-formylglutamate amidohydrolase n=1 Tax=Candidimonas sp. SYP-B2681 TaxID=2497686 RepID=UPI000F86C807|nr:N-formylglutamate amidohydrolase [Candidimonas sp. SYP-B2681]RTZ45566.1 N-formylglutamate amidohydrolase [Candidimonas sp. SYP-B2681]
MTQALTPPVIRKDPVGAVIPLVCDSPHSGTAYPEDFRYAVPRQLLRQGEDTHVDELWAAAPQHGATLIAATFPRVYIDPNRTLQDLDPEALDGTWPDQLEPTVKTRLGKGLVWTRLDARTPIYDRKLGIAEVRSRINDYYRPYHDAIAQAIEERYDRFAALWHLNLHSMPNDAYERLGLQSDRPLADFVLGDRDGTTCEPEFVQLIEDVLRSKGYTVARNDPYKGVQLIAQIGQPALNRHSLQIEVRRPVYMDEITRERNGGFDQLQTDLTALLAVIATYIKDRVGIRV